MRNIKCPFSRLWQAWNFQFGRLSFPNKLNFISFIRNSFLLPSYKVITINCMFASEKFYPNMKIIPFVLIHATRKLQWACNRILLLRNNAMWEFIWKFPDMMRAFSLRSRSHSHSHPHPRSRLHCLCAVNTSRESFHKFYSQYNIPCPQIPDDGKAKNDWIKFNWNIFYGEHEHHV